MQIFCRQCGAEIQANDINLDNMMAKCANCNAVFSFADMYEEITPKAAKQKFLDDVPKPNGITIQNDDFQLEITRKWLSFDTIVIGVLALIWNGMTWGLFVPVMGLSRLSRLGIQTFLLPFMVAMGIVMLYITISGFLNTTLIKVDTENLSIRHGPVPYPGKNLASHDIDQIYTQQVHRGSVSTTYAYELHVITLDGKKKKLIGGLYNSKQALYIEQEIERFLGIEDRPVRGGYR